MDDDIEGLKAEEKELEARIADLPEGYITRSAVGGEVRYFHRRVSDGMTIDRQVEDDEVEWLKMLFEERRSCLSRLKLIRVKLEKAAVLSENGGYHNRVLTGDDLLEWASEAADLPRRDCFGVLDDYIRGDDNRVCILYGLPSTGKTTLIRQAVTDLGPEGVNRAAYIKISGRYGTHELDRDLSNLTARGIRIFFIDEATLMRDFISGSALLSTFFVPDGARIILSGTDSLSFWFAEDDSLYESTVTIHTTHIPFREHSRLRETSDVDEYVRCGGILGHAPPIPPEAVRAYTDRAVSQNIRNSLVNNVLRSSLSPFQDLYEAGRLTDAIDILLEVQTVGFVLSAIGETDGPEDSRAGLDAVVDALRRRMESLDAECSSIGMAEGKSKIVFEYLRILDAAVCYRKDVGDGLTNSGVMATQPGIRYAQVEALIGSLHGDAVLRDSVGPRLDPVLRDVEGVAAERILEDVVLLDTMASLGSGFEVFRLMVRGKAGIVVLDRERAECLILGIDGSAVRGSHLGCRPISEELESYVEERYGRIVGRYVLCRGVDPTAADGFGHLDLTGFLKGLSASAKDLFPVNE